MGVLKKITTVFACCLSILAATGVPATADMNCTSLSGDVLSSTATGVAQNRAARVMSNAELCKLYGGFCSEENKQTFAISARNRVKWPSVKTFALVTDQYLVKEYIFGGGAKIRFLYETDGISGSLIDVRLNRFYLKPIFSEVMGVGLPFVCSHESLVASVVRSTIIDEREAKWLRIGGGIAFDSRARSAWTGTTSPAYDLNDFKILLDSNLFTQLNQFGFSRLQVMQRKSERGDFPKKGIGWRNGRPAAEPPYTASLYIDNGKLQLYGETPWAY